MVTQPTPISSDRATADAEAPAREDRSPWLQAAETNTGVRENTGEGGGLKVQGFRRATGVGPFPS